MPGVVSYQIMVCYFFNMLTSIKKFKVFFFFVLSGWGKNNRKFSCCNSLFSGKTLTYYPHCTISMWGQYEKSIVACIHFIRNERVQAPGCPPFLTLHHPPTLEASTHTTKTIQLYSLPLVLFHNIGIWNAGLVYCTKLKSVLVWLTEYHPVLRVSTPYQRKYVPFE